MDRNNNSQTQHQTTEKRRIAEIVSNLQDILMEHEESLFWFLENARDEVKMGLCKAVAKYGLSNVIAAASDRETVAVEEHEAHFDLGNLLEAMYITLETDRPEL